MNAIARTIKTRIPLVTFTSRGLLGFLLIIGIILLIIFLPEITGIHFRRSQVEQATTFQPVTQSALSEILAELNERSERKPFAPTIREEASQALHEKGFTWDVIRSDAVRGAIIKAKNQCAQLMESLPADRTFARFALANYQLALEQMAQGKDERFSAAGALGYLRHLDEQVTDSFRSDQIEGPLFKRWAEISLGDALQTAENRVYREGEVTPFNPELTLNRVMIHRVLPGTVVTAKNFNDQSKITIEGSILFQGTKKLSLFHNGKFVSEVEIPRPRKRQEDPHVFFAAEAGAYQGVFSLRAESTDREVYIKSYSFYPRIARFADNPRQADYRLGTFRQRLLKLDQLFLVGESSPDSAPDGMVRF